MKSLLVLLPLLAVCSGDPETVEGLIQKKRLDPGKNGVERMRVTPAQTLPPRFRHEFMQGPFNRIWRTRAQPPATSTTPKSSTTKQPLLMKMAQTPSSTFEDINEISPSSETVTRAQEGPITNVNEVTPVFSALSQKKSDLKFEEDDNNNGALTLIIGIAFVAVFVGMSVSLVAIQSSWNFNGCPVPLIGEPNKSNDLGRDHGFDHEDQTPPELRGLGSQPSFVQPDVKSKDISSNEQSPPLFYGKLMLNDSPTENQEGVSANKTSTFVSSTMNSMASIFLAAQEAISRSPSPTSGKEEVPQKDLMVMDPKAGGSEGDESPEEDGSEEEESDDTVYECRGLASPGEMEVTNPFYLHGQDAFSLEGRRVPAHETPPPLTPKPISQVPLLHQGIKGYN